MPINLFFSNDTMQLFDKLCDNYQPDDIFNPDPILVGGQMGTWLQYHMAQRDGIVANLNIGRLEKHLWGILQELDTFENGVAKSLDKASLTQFVAHALMDSDRLEKEVYAPVKQYLGEKSQDELYYRKLLQISQQVATVFIDYEFKRIKSAACNGVIESWLDADALMFSKNFGKGVRPDEETWYGQVELWQKYLYRELFSTGGILDRYVEKNSDWYCSLPMYARQVFAGAVQSEKCEGVEWHIFAMSQISLFHRSLIFKLSEMGLTFNIYALNPCAEYWEDLVPEQGKNSLRSDSWARLMSEEKELLRHGGSSLAAEELEEVNDGSQPLLEQWGRPGREGIKLWCQAVDYEFEELYHLEDNGLVLSQIQKSLLNRTTDLEVIEQDASVQFWKAPEIKREVETLYDSIVHTLCLNESIRFHDIAVFVTDVERYAPVVKQVFDARNSRSAEYIPYSIIDASQSESFYAQAIKGLFALAGGMMTRKEIFELLSNPCVEEALGVDAAQVKIFVQWADTLKVYRHFDNTHRKESGYADGAIHTWRLALDKLLLGSFLEKGEKVDLEGQRIPAYADIDSAQLENVSQFVTIIEELYIDTQCLKKSRTVQQWIEFLPQFFNTWLGIPEEHARENEVKKVLFDHIPTITLIQKKSSILEWALIKESMITAIGGLPGYTGSYLTGGVTIASLSPKPPVPYKCIYILGMNEGVFPSRSQYSGLDLRGCRREVGDFTPLETDRYLFLELLTSVTEQFVVSYLSVDIKKDEVLQESSIVVELKEFLERYILKDVLRWCVIPLLNGDQNIFEGSYSKALVAHSDGLNHWYTVPGYSVAQEKMGRLLQNPLLVNSEPEKLKASKGDGVVHEVLGITSSMIKRYLQNPLEYRLQRNFSLWGDEEDRAIDSDEPLGLDILEGGALKSACSNFILGERFVRHSEITALRLAKWIENYFKEQMISGVLPSAALGLVAQKVLLNGVDDTVEVMAKIEKEVGEEYVFIEAHSVSYEYEVPCDGGVRKVQLNTETSGLFVSQKGELPILVVPNNYTKKYSAKNLLAPYANYLILSQSDEYKETFSKGVRLFIWNVLEDNKLKKVTISLSSMGARKQLTQLVHEMASDEPVYNLPFDALMADTQKPGEKFAALGCTLPENIPEYFRGIAEGDEMPIIDAMKSRVVFDAIETKWKELCEKEYTPRYYAFDKVHTIRTDSLEVFVKRFGALIGAEHV